MSDEAAQHVGTGERIEQRDAEWRQSPTPEQCRVTRPPGAEVPSCAFCRTPIGADDVALTLFRDGTPYATYHEHCRPDRRRNGCGGAACRL